MDFDKNLKKVVEFTLKRYPTFASELATLKIYYRDFVKQPLEIEENGKTFYEPISTAATDHKNIYINKPFFEKATFENQVFLLSHEIMHVKFEHSKRMKNKDGSTKMPLEWNFATDYVINGNLVQDGFLKPTYETLGIETNKDKNQCPFLFREDATKFSSEELYDQILKEKEEENQRDNQGQNRSSGQSDDQGGNQGEDKQDQEKKQQQNQGGSQDKNEEQQEQDGNEGQQNSASEEQVENHGLWEKTISKEQQEELDNQVGENGKTQQEENEERQQQIRNSKTFKNQQKENEQNQNFQDTSKFEDSKKEQTINEKDFLKKNKEVKINNNPKYGSKINFQDDMLTDFGKQQIWDNSGKSKNVANWKAILRREKEKEEDIWSNRRGIAENNYAKRLEDYEEEDKSKTEVLIDISGSVSDGMVKNILRQTKNIYKEGELVVGTFNLKFWGFTTIKTEKDIENFSIPEIARGNASSGQNMDLAVRSFSKEKHVNKLVFTDGGYVGQEMPKEDLKNEKIMWIVYGDQEFEPICGKVIRVRENAFDAIKDDEREM